MRNLGLHALAELVNPSTGSILFLSRDKLTTTNKSRYPSSHEHEILMRFLPNKVHYLPIHDAVNVALAQECSKPMLRIAKSPFDGLLRYTFSSWLTG
jgi:hypothetical protein